MRFISHRNINQAYGHGLWILQTEGVLETSRGGDVLVLPTPMVTTYLKPDERVLFSPARDANPYFHLFEAMWILAGRRDGAFLDTYVSDFSQRFGETDGDIHGAYGHRWRRHFDLEGGGAPGMPDQLATCIRLLTEDPDSRQVVLTMWDPVADLGTTRRDRPCNTQVYFRVHQLHGELDMTVLCRSNDAVWGAYGSNVVHFSVLHEFVASAIGRPMGAYRQFSHNFHVYKWWLDKNGPVDERHTHGLSHDLYTRGGDSISPVPLFGDTTKSWQGLLAAIEAWCDDPIGGRGPQGHSLFDHLLVPMARSHQSYRRRAYEAALSHLDAVLHPDWALAARQWLGQRAERRLAKAAERTES
jgi:thymidylate synthase